jgi:hypothetical protein
VIVVFDDDSYERMQSFLAAITFKDLAANHRSSEWLARTAQVQWGAH